MAVEHSGAKPELDWWIESYKGGTPGNRKLNDINDRSEKEFGIDQLPARSGVFSRSVCNRQIVLDENQDERIKIEGDDESRKAVKYCRLCEFSCPVGQ